jgi:hypothetical protein
MGKREPQIILKTDERKVTLELGLQASSQPNQPLGTKTGYSLRATSSRSQVKNGRWVLTHLPAGPRPAPSRPSTTFRPKCNAVTGL